MEYVKCSNCKGTGRVLGEHSGGKWVRCPVCKGKGKKSLNDKTNTKQGGR